jgi:hypothetical protein
MVVPPTATKTAFYDNRVLASQWSAGARALRAAEELVLIGYSSPASDLVFGALLRTNLTNGTIIPVNTSADVVQRTQEIFGEDACDRVVDSYAGAGNQIDRYVKTFCT